MTIPNEMSAFLESLLIEAGIKEPTPRLKEAMLQDLAGRLQQWFLMTVTRELEPADVADLDQLQGQGASSEEIQYFLGQRISNLPKIMAQAMFDFRKAYLGLPS